jgi:HPt (histidine-containing phosphotransfer) domain-containing protein
MTLAFSDTLAELRRQFATQLPARMDAINTLARSLGPAVWHPAEAEPLYRLLQSLTNSAGIFGMQQVSDAARTLETRLAVLLKARAAPTAAEWLAIRSDLDRMDQLARMQSAVRCPAAASGPAAVIAGR